MSANHLTFSPESAISSLIFAAEVIAQWQAGKEVVVTFSQTGIKVDGKPWIQIPPVDLNANEQHASVKKMTGELGHLLEECATVSKGLKAANSEARSVNAQLQATVTELREAAAPFREMFKDERTSKAKADALKAGVPELVVNAIVREKFLHGFPRIGTLINCLSTSGDLNKLEAAGHGRSRATVARWLRVMRNIMVKYGHVEKYRTRCVANPAKPSTSPETFCDAEAGLPQGGNTGLTQCDTRGQELTENGDESDKGGF
jgi:hypothetical protein